MIPIQLTLQGLYSYKEKQTIDFEPLIAAGLFGLFGAVGSGKSSILEAIMLALFNKTERLSINKDRNYNIMNLQSDVLYIDFIFFGGSSNSQKYRAIYHTRRNSKNFNDVTLKERAYYQWHENDWLPLDLENASSILGNMSYESFMKTVIIPQGKFREFVDQSTNERTKMLKELFPLDKFDLFNKTGKLLTQTKADLQTTEKLLEEIGEAGEEDINLIQEEIVSLKTMQQSGSEKLKDLRKTEEELRKLKGLFEEYGEVADVLKQLYSEKEFFEKKERQLATYNKAFTYFREKLTTLSNSTAEIKQKKDFVEELDAEIKTFSEALEHASGELVSAKENLKEIDKAKQQCEDLKTIIEIGKATKLAEGKQKEATLAEAALSEIKTSLEIIKKQIAGLEEDVLKKEIGLQDLDLLKERKLWLEKSLELKKEKKDIESRTKELIDSGEAYRENIKKLLNSLEESPNSLDDHDPLKFLNSKIAAIRKACNALQEQLIPVQVKQQLAAYSAALHEGDPCPLCGATHHPDPSEYDEVNSEIARLENEIKHLTRKETTISNLMQEIQRIHATMAGNEELLKDAMLQLERVEQKIAIHTATENKISDAFNSLQEVEKELSRLMLTQKELKLNREKAEALRKSLGAKETLLEDKRNSLQQALQDKVREEEKVNQLNRMLKIYTFSKFQNHSLEELNASRERGLSHIANLNENHEKAASKVQKLEHDLHSFKGQYAAEEKALSLLVEKTEQFDLEVQELVKEKGFYSVAEIKEILKMPLNMGREKQEIETYKNKLLQVEQRYKQLQKQIDNREYLPSQYQEIIQEIEDLEEEMNSTQSKISIRQREISEIQQKIARRAFLEKEQEALELRKQNLSELCNLFRGSGFINYVSSIYLSNLCKAANERFLKLTKNNLSLELNEQNDFIIRDFLNNGKTRLLKTLSGGQTFQASLCLALALAENVKALNQADQSFFFLDEGFGALDKNALRVVFDTLKTLRKENRVVGIISHVEELQQEIDVYLEVENDRERGSQVRYSWK